LDPTFGSFTLLELVSFLWWKCLRLERFFLCFVLGVQSVDTVSK
jgi:hypothetical protein